MKTLEQETIPEQVIKTTNFPCPCCNKMMLFCPGSKSSFSDGFTIWCSECVEVYGHTQNSKLEIAYNFILDKFPNGRFNPRNKQKSKIQKNSLEEILEQ